MLKPFVLGCTTQMNVLHALGYSMIITDGSREALDDVYRAYHDRTVLVFWGDWHSTGWGCLRDPTCVYSDDELPIPAPNRTHLNVPIW